MSLTASSSSRTFLRSACVSWTPRSTSRTSPANCPRRMRAFIRTPFVESLARGRRTPHTVSTRPADVRTIMSNDVSAVTIHRMLIRSNDSYGRNRLFSANDKLAAKISSTLSYLTRGEEIAYVSSTIPDDAAGYASVIVLTESRVIDLTAGHVGPTARAFSRRELRQLEILSAPDLISSDVWGGTDSVQVRLVYPTLTVDLPLEMASASEWAREQLTPLIPSLLDDLSAIPTGRE
jgi:hypothetical protein